MRNPADLARKCFALAKSPGTAAEGEAALARGMAIIERHGLNADDFDIPGRQRSVSGKRAEHVIIDEVFSGAHNPFYDYFYATQRQEGQKAAEAMRAAAEQLRAEALRRQFAEDIARRSSQQRWATRVDVRAGPASTFFNDQSGS